MPEAGSECISHKSIASLKTSLVWAFEFGTIVNIRDSEGQFEIGPNFLSLSEGVPLG
jgi:hypothetical protein